MGVEVVDEVRRLPDGELLSRVKAFAGGARESAASLVAHLGELERRDLHLEAGYGSLFAFCRDALGLAEGDAYNHVEVARVARRLPAIVQRLAAGLSLATARMLAPFLTPENHEAVLDEARGKRRGQVEEIAARLWPQPDVPSSIRRLPPLGPSGIAPLSPDRYRLQVTIAGATLDRLRLAKDMLRHSVPSGDDSVILDRALAALLDDLARTKFAATDNPRPGKGAAPGSRHIPAEIRRAVWVRDLGRCAFVAKGGRRCDERALLEFHHVRPFADGGVPPWPTSSCAAGATTTTRLAPTSATGGRRSTGVPPARDNEPHGPSHLPRIPGPPSLRGRARAGSSGPAPGDRLSVLTAGPTPETNLDTWTFALQEGGSCSRNGPGPSSRPCPRPPWTSTSTASRPGRSSTPSGAG
jgi:hypothetical protein